MAKDALAKNVLAKNYGTDVSIFPGLNGLMDPRMVMAHPP